MALEYVNNRLQFSGQDVSALADTYGTPLIVYDENIMRHQMRRYHNVLTAKNVPYSVSYASKAFSTLEMVRILEEENMELDVVSIGELYTALKAGFNPMDIHFHGNNKTPEEIKYAINHDVRFFVIDSVDEIQLIDDIADSTIDVLIRINPGVDVDTHEFISTGQEDSKFGMSLLNGTALRAVNDIHKSEHLNFKGVHYHLGSQLSSEAPFINALIQVYDWLDAHELTIEILNMGGGYGVVYTEEDTAFPVEKGFDAIIDKLKELCSTYQFDIPHVMIEPGRSITAEAAVTVYEVGTVKKIPGVSTYLSVDGGMSDHIRTPLYGAEYDIIPVETTEDATASFHVVGKLCESGDIIGKDKLLPQNIKRGDRLVVKTTGAYHYSMASNYNQMRKPAVIFINDEGVKEVVKRQTLDQLIQNDI
jgi:diaminopimelate decarboxylase